MQRVWREDSYLIWGLKSSTSIPPAWAACPGGRLEAWEHFLISWIYLCKEHIRGLSLAYILDYIKIRTAFFCSKYVTKIIEILS